MGVYATHYFRIGFKLTDDPDFDKYETILDNYPQYSQYEFIRQTTATQSNIRLIVDGMNGRYAYLVYVIKETDAEDMWKNSTTVEFPFNSIKSADVVKELQEVYSLFADEKELRTQNIKIISLFHAS